MIAGSSRSWGRTEGATEVTSYRRKSSEDAGDVATAKGKTDSSNTTCQDIITRGDVKAPITLMRRWIDSSNTICQDIITRGDVKAPITLVRRWIA